MKHKLPIENTDPNELEHYSRQWGLSSPQLIAQTAIASVFKVDQSGNPAAMKIFTELGREDEGRGSNALEYFDGRGSVRLLRQDEHAQLLEYLEGPSLLDVVKTGKDDQATQVICDVLTAIHSVRAKRAPERLIPLRERYRSLFEIPRTLSPSPENEIFSEATKITTQLLDHPLDERVLHGDLHHENILQSSRGWIAIDPKGLIGESTFDAANAFYNPIALPDLVQNPARIERTAQAIADRLSLDYQRYLSFAFTYGCLSACWSIEDGGDPKHALKVARVIRSWMQP